MRFPGIKVLFWAGIALTMAIQAERTPNEIVRAIYLLCMIVSMATAFLLKAIREK